MVDPSLVADVELLADLSPEELATVAGEATLRRLERAAVLFDEGAEPGELYVVVSGRVAVASRAAGGRESVRALMEPGDLFGELALFGGFRRFGTARALEASEVVVIPYGPLRSIYERRPALLWRVVGLLAGRLRAMDETLADTVFLDVTGRTAKRLLEVAGLAEEFVLPVTQEELAGMVGASRERVNKAIASFVRLGWIEQSERRYRITDREQLTARAR